MKDNAKNPAWNIFQGKMRILKRKQKQVLSDFRQRLTDEKISKIKKEI